MSGEKGIKSGERFLTGNRVIYLFYIVYVIKNDRSLSHPIDITNKFLKKTEQCPVSVLSHQLAS